MFDVDGPTRGVTIDLNPGQRTRLTTTTLVAEGPGAISRSYTEEAEWDGAGNMTQTTMTDLGNGVGRTSSTSFDALGRPRNAADPTGRVTELAFDLGGRVVTRIERVGLSSARETSFGHDAMGRVVVETPEQAPETTHVYDRAGRRRVTTSGEGAKAFTTQWQFDAAGRIAERETLRGIEGPSNPPRLTEWSYPANRAAPNELTVDAAVAKSWTRDGLERPVVATDFNVSDGTPTFNASRPTLATSLSYDTLGRVRVDETEGWFPASSPTLPNAQKVLLSRATWVHPSTFLGPTSITTKNGEEVRWSYSSRGTLNAIRRFGPGVGAPVLNAELSMEGGQWTRAAIGSVTLDKKRDAFGFVTSSSATTSNDGVVFEETLLRGPTGRITAELRSGVLFSNRARSFRYDALQRLNQFKVDTNTAMTLATFLADTNAVLADEDAGFDVLTAVDATVTLTSTKADIVTSASVDHEGRGYASLEDSAAAGVPLIDVNSQAIARDTRDRIASDGDLDYTWDVLDRLVLVERDGQEELRIAYDGVGRRRLERKLVTTPAGNVLEDAVLEYAGANVIEEYAADGSDVYLTVTHAPGIDTPLFASDGATSASASTWVVGTNARGDASSAIDLASQDVDEGWPRGPILDGERFEPSSPRSCGRIDRTGGAGETAIGKASTKQTRLTAIAARAVCRRAHLTGRAQCAVRASSRGTGV